MEQDDVTLWLGRLGQGDEQAAGAIWSRYFHQLVRLARQKMEGTPRRAADEEDVAVSAMESFYQGMAAGKFDWVSDRNDLWKLLVTIAARKVYGQVRRQKTQKRGGGKVRGESVFQRPGEEDQKGIDLVLGDEPSPELAALLAESLRLKLDQLDDSLRDVAVRRMQGYTNEEIAVQLNCAVRTVERKLERIRKKWESESPEEPDDSESSGDSEGEEAGGK